MAQFLADVLSHPKVERALSQTIVLGMNATLEQPGFAARINKVTQDAMRDTTEQDNSQLSRQMGEQFPKLAAQFLGGAVASARGKVKKDK